MGSDRAKGRALGRVIGFQFTLPHGERPCLRRSASARPRVSIHAPAWGATIIEAKLQCEAEVSIHAPAWGATSPARPGGRGTRGFQFTLPHGERPGRACRRCPGRRFQFTLPHGERPVWYVNFRGIAEFQFTLPHGERPRRTRALRRLACWFQFTLPHGERPRRPGIAQGWLEVSIHAPAWGATRSCTNVMLEVVRFNSRSRMGSDPASSICSRRLLAFQFTLPHGERPRQTLADNRNLRVSIHAPAWGATPRRRHRRRDGRGFNSRSRMGSDHFETQKRNEEYLFQFTLPHGERPSCGKSRHNRIKVSIHAPAWGATSTACRTTRRPLSFQFTLPHGERPCGREVAGAVEEGFNSRSRMGSDHRQTLADNRNLRVSIHAPAWGATLGGLTTFLGMTSFQFTLPHGERPGARGARPTASAVSIHAPAWGATPCATSGRSRTATFQFTLPHGERPLEQYQLEAAAMFQFTLPHGERPRSFERGSQPCKVSIHAPAWGATIQLRHAPDDLQGFNSRSRMGSDQAATAKDESPARFNSRSRMGSDREGLVGFHPHLVSIHAPAWGATLEDGAADGGGGGFNSRSRMGSDRGIGRTGWRGRRFQFTLPHGERPHAHDDMARVTGVSIHAPAWGATSAPPPRPPSWASFQFTLPHGERPALGGVEEAPLDVSIHAPAWGATPRRARYRAPP